MIAGKMAVKIEDINSPRKLEEYLKEQPKELAVAIASRSALRVLPFIFYAYNRDYKHNVELTTTVFRSNYISWTKSNWPTYDMRLAADASDTYGSDAASHIAHAALAAATVATAAHAHAHAQRTWTSIQEDLFAFQIEDVGEKIDNFTNLSLWAGGVPVEFQEQWLPLKNKLFEMDSNWQIWIDWYEYVLHGSKSPKRGIAVLSDKLLIELAQKPNKFWDREPEVVNAEIAGWVEEENKLEKWMGEESDIGEPKKVEEAEADLSSRTNYSKSEISAVISAVKTNKESIALSSASALLLISDYREKVRGDNQLESDFRLGLLDFLDTLTDDFEKLSELISKLVSEPTDENAKSTLNWLDIFKSRFNANCKLYIAPENVADATLPTGIILTCASISGLVGGAIGGPLVGISGFGVGTFLGKVITGFIKPSKIFDKINESLENDDDKIDAE